MANFSSKEVQFNISEKTYELVIYETEFAFESRGKTEAKGRGEIEMFFVSLKPEKNKKRHTTAPNITWPSLCH